MEEKEEKSIREYLKLYIYYILIAVLSLVSIVVFPILGAVGTDVSHALKSAFPNDTIGWVFWGIARLLIIVLNMLIFTNFLHQAKVNVKDEEKYKQANEILSKCKSKDYIPRSPKEYLGKTYATKGLILAITTGISLFGIGSAILNYDYMLLIATVFTVIMSIIFGVMTMKKVEVYYITEYYDYAKSRENKINKGDIEKCLHTMEKNIEIYKNK